MPDCKSGWIKYLDFQLTYLLVKSAHEIVGSDSPWSLFAVAGVSGKFQVGQVSSIRASALQASFYQLAANDSGDFLEYMHLSKRVSSLAYVASPLIGPLPVYDQPGVHLQPGCEVFGPQVTRCLPAHPCVVSTSPVLSNANYLLTPV